MRPVGERQAGQKQEQETVTGPDAGRRLGEAQQGNLLLGRLQVGANPPFRHPPSRHPSFGLVTENGADDVRHDIPGGEHQRLGQPCLVAERTFERPVRQGRRHGRPPECSAAITAGSSAPVRSIRTRREGSEMAIDKQTRAEILRLYFAEKWKIGTIARQRSSQHGRPYPSSPASLR